MDHTAFVALFEFHFEALMGFACSYIPDEEVAKDVVHDAFLTLWDNRKKIDHSWSLKNYLFTLTRNNALNYIRHQRVIAHNELPLARELSEEENDPLLIEQQLAKLREKVGLLPEKQRTMVMECIVKGRTYKEVATEMEISLNTAKTHIKRALKFLREALQDDQLFLLFFLQKEVNYLSP